MVELTKGITDYSDSELRELLAAAREEHEATNELFLAALDVYRTNEANVSRREERDGHKAEVFRLFNLIQSIETDMVRRFTS